MNSQGCPLDQCVLDELKAWFADYVGTFACDDPELARNISLKREHTLRVCEEIVSVGRELGLRGGELLLAEVTALFHDIGRFEQFRRYRTFVDSRSVNHAELGVSILKAKGVLALLDEQSSDLAMKVISYHNRARLPEQEDPTCLLYARLLRDADKLDIWHILTSYYARQGDSRNRAIELDLPDVPEISPAVYEDLMSGRVVEHGAVKTLNDFKMLQCAWIFDINFTPTLRRVRQRRYLESIRETMPDSQQVGDIFSMLESSMSMHLLDQGNTLMALSETRHGTGLTGEVRGEDETVREKPCFFSSLHADKD